MMSIMRTNTLLARRTKNKIVVRFFCDNHAAVASATTTSSDEATLHFVVIRSQLRAASKDLNHTFLKVVQRVVHSFSPRRRRQKFRNS
jgi:hypothetical protein